ncbi:tail fiber protein [Klebsiella phage VLCpiM5b]|nr:tail fiber protein [Klebsiella phage VLCpiM5b]
MLQSVKISELPSADTLTEDDLIVVDQPDDTKKATLFQVVSKIEESVENTTLDILSEPDGASKSYSKNSPVSLLLRRSIFEYMTEEDRDTISGTLGIEVIVDYALQNAINDGVSELHFPPVKGIYVLGQTQITLPSGFSMTGVSAKPYTASSNTSFNNRGTVLRLYSGASSIFIMTNRHRFFNIIFDGRDKSVNLMKGVGTDQTQYCRFDSCGVYRWLNGFGGSSSSGYTATLQLIGCAIASNYRGIRNLIDSRITDCNINANDTAGVELNAGANNNSFVNVRNEWNGTYNWFCSGGKRNIVVGELCDRAGTNAFAAVNGGQWIVNGVTVQRSGKNAIAGTADDAHFYIAGAGSVLILSGVYTLVGVNDDGSGNSTPSYILASDSSGTDDKTFIAAGSKLDGYSSTSYIRPGSAIAKTSILGCIGVQDTVNTGFHQVRNGRWHLGDSARNITLPAGVGSTVSMTFPATDSDFAQYSVGFSRSIEIMGRNGTTGSESRFFCKMMIKRESSSAVINPDAQRVESQVDLSGGSWGLSSSSPTGVSVSFAISTDARVITVTLTNVDGAARVVSAELLP